MMFPGHHHMPRQTRIERKAYDAAFDEWAAKEAERVATQRGALAKAQPNAEVIKLMLDRAWALLDASECEAADALLEFVPEEVASKLLDEFFND
jgi:hypothetical protein